jgi:hypothetical protein
LVDITRAFAERAANSAQLRRTIAEQARRLLGGYCLLGLVSDDLRSWHLVADFSPHSEHAAELRRVLDLHITPGAELPACHLDSNQMERVVKMRPGLKVLYISGYGEHAVVNQGVLEPGAPFVQEPILPSVLLRRVRALLSEGREAVA